MITKRFTATCAAALLAITSASGAWAANILFAHVDNAFYTADGNDIRDMLVADGHNVTTVFLDDAVISDFSSYSQVWVYDLYSSPDLQANQLQNYTNIANWYNGLAKKNLIADGRIISSAPDWTDCSEPGLGCPGSTMSPEDAWIQNYAVQLALRGGGLMLGTDHNVFHSGINNINNQIGIDPFTGFYASVPYQATVDDASPLFISSLDFCGYGAPTTDYCVNDNSSTGIAPSGLQSNGQTLTPLAWHGTLSQASTNTAISTTMGSITFGTCGGPGQEPCGVPEPAPVALLGLALVGMIVRRRTARPR